MRSGNLWAVWTRRWLRTERLRAGLALMILGVLVPSTACARRTGFANGVYRRRTIAVDFIDNFSRLLDAIRTAIAVDLLLRVVMDIIIEVGTPRWPIVAFGQCLRIAARR